MNKIKDLLGRRVVCISKEPLLPFYYNYPEGFNLTTIKNGDEGFVVAVTKHPHGMGWEIQVEVEKASSLPPLTQSRTLLRVTSSPQDPTKSGVTSKFSDIFALSKPTLIRIRKRKDRNLFNNIEVLFLNLDKEQDKYGEPSCRSFSLVESHSECVLTHPRFTPIKEQDEEQVLDTLRCLTTYPYNYHLRLEAQTLKHLLNQGFNYKALVEILKPTRIINP